MYNNKLLLASHKIIFNNSYIIYYKLFNIIMIDHFRILAIGLELAIVAHFREYHWKDYLQFPVQYLECKNSLLLQLLK